MKQACSYVQVSLMQLLNNEHAIVSKLNEVNKALEVAKSSNLRCNEYIKQRDSLNTQLTKAREEINKYLTEKIQIQL